MRVLGGRAALAAMARASREHIPDSEIKKNLGKLYVLNLDPKCKHTPLKSKISIIPWFPERGFQSVVSRAWFPEEHWGTKAEAFVRQ